MLQTSEGAKTLVLIFYTAIIYHLATFIKAKKEEGANIQEPAVLAFSGNGSKLLQVLGVSTQVGKQMLCTYTKAIFEKVNGRPYAHVNFNIVIDPDKPKEATCKGGLLVNNFGAASNTVLEANKNLFASDVKLRTSNALTFMRLLNSPNPIEDTLFFYPITEMLNLLARKLL